MITDNTEVEINSVLASVKLFLRDKFQEMELVHKSFKLTPAPQGSTSAVAADFSSSKRQEPQAKPGCACRGSRLGSQHPPVVTQASGDVSSKASKPSSASVGAPGTHIQPGNAQKLKVIFKT